MAARKNGRHGKTGRFTPAAKAVTEPEPEKEAEGSVDDDDDLGKVPLRRFNVDALMREAELVGHQNPTALLSLLEAKRPDLDEVRRQIDALRDKNGREYYVAGPGSVIIHGKAIGPGEIVRMTKAEAASMGAAVSETKPPPPSGPIGEREAGRYRVEGPGSVRLSGTTHGPGAEIVLTEADARDLSVALTFLGAD